MEATSLRWKGRGPEKQIVKASKRDVVQSSELT